MCGLDCDDAKDSCTKGSAIKERIDWPGQPGLQVLGVFVDDERIVTEEGVGLGVSACTPEILSVRPCARAEPGSHKASER